MSHFNKTKRIEELDALRGIAALWVVFFHFTMGRGEYCSFFRFGTTGVDLFFMISGFVIFLSLQNLANGMEFVINRFSRLYPTYWAAVLITFTARVLYNFKYGAIEPQPSLRDLWTNLTMFQFYFGAPDMDAPYWTMIIEMLFYLVMLLLFQFKLLRFITVLGIAVSGLSAVLAVFFFDVEIVKWSFKWFPLLQFFPLFFSGIIFYKIYAQKKKVMGYYFVLLFCFLCQIALFPHAGKAQIFINQSQYCQMLSVYFCLFILFVNKKLNFLVNKVTLFFGKISFSLYLIHQFISRTLIIKVLHDGKGWNFWIVSLFIALPVVVLLAYLITYFIELSFSPRLKRKLNSVVFKNSSMFVKASPSSMEI